MEEEFESQDCVILSPEPLPGLSITTGYAFEFKADEFYY
jgi:hypothetical protein